jgi:hypothetical protein
MAITRSVQAATNSVDGPPTPYALAEQIQTFQYHNNIEPKQDLGSMTPDALPRKRPTDEAQSMDSKPVKRSKSLPDCKEDESRMLCPFYMKDPKNSGIKSSCFAKGFAEVAKLRYNHASFAQRFRMRFNQLTMSRDHLKSVHFLSAELQERLNFRNEPFRSLGDKDAKWTLAFRIIFPEVPQNQIPLPRLSESRHTPKNYIPVTPEIQKHTLKLQTLKYAIEHQLFWARYDANETLPDEVFDLFLGFNLVFENAAKMWLDPQFVTPEGVAPVARNVDVTLGVGCQPISTVSVDLDLPPLKVSDESGSKLFVDQVSAGDSPLNGVVEHENTKRMDSPSPTNESFELCNTNLPTPPESPVSMTSVLVLNVDASISKVEEINEEIDPTLPGQIDIPTPIKVESPEEIHSVAQFSSASSELSMAMGSMVDSSDEWIEFFNLVALDACPNFVPQQVDDNHSSAKADGTVVGQANIVENTDQA